MTFFYWNRYNKKNYIYIIQNTILSIQLFKIKFCIGDVTREGGFAVISVPVRLVFLITACHCFYGSHPRDFASFLLVLRVWLGFFCSSFTFVLGSLLSIRLFALFSFHFISSHGFICFPFFASFPLLLFLVAAL